MTGDIQLLPWLWFLCLDPLQCFGFLKHHTGLLPLAGWTIQGKVINYFTFPKQGPALINVIQVQIAETFIVTFLMLISVKQSPINYEQNF